MAEQTPNELFYSADAEQAILGCILHDPRLLADARAVLTPADFWLLRHKYVFDAMLRLADAGQAVDMITIAGELRRHGDQFDQVGGHAYLAQLAGALVSTRNLDSYAREVADKAYALRLLQAGDRLKELALLPAMSADERSEQAASVVAMAARETDTSGDYSPIAEEVDDYRRAVEATRGLPAGIGGLTTGFYDLDDLLDGLQPRSLNLLGGRPGMGKSAMLMAIALHVAKWGGSVYLWSGEMPKTQLRERAMAVEAGVVMAKLRRGLRQNGMDTAEYTRFKQAAERLAKLNLWFDDAPAITPTKLHARAERLARKIGGLDLIIVDYLGLMNPGDGLRASAKQNRNLELGGITKFLKQETAAIAPVLAGAQLSRALESRQDKRPVLNDLRDSGELENDADVVLFAYRDVVYNPAALHPHEMELIVRKNRHGGLGTVKLYFEDQFTRVGNSAYKSIEEVS